MNKLEKTFDNAGIGKFMVTDRVIDAYLNSFIDLSYSDQTGGPKSSISLNDCRNIQETARVLIENYEPESEWGENLVKVLRKAKTFVDDVIISNEPMNDREVIAFLKILDKEPTITMESDY